MRLDFRTLQGKGFNEKDKYGKICKKLVLAVSFLTGTLIFSPAWAEEGGTLTPAPAVESDAPSVNMEERKARREQFKEKKEQVKEKMRHKLKQADTDGNGSISYDEAQKEMPRLAEHFDQVDDNGDGEISPGELKQHVRAKARERIEERRAEKQSSLPATEPAPQ